MVHPESFKSHNFSPGVKLELVHIVENSDGSLKAIVGCTFVASGYMQKEKSALIFYKKQKDKFEIQWKTDIMWKSGYYTYFVEESRIITSNDYLFLARPMKDSRRFLSGEHRLDIEICCYEIDSGKLLWNNIHEVSCETQEKKLERGYDLKVYKTDFLVVRSYIFDGTIGSANCSVYSINNGSSKKCKTSKLKTISKIPDQVKKDDKCNLM